jgi:hypothetical protein
MPDKKKLSAVFTTVGLPPYTYVKPSYYAVVSRFYCTNSIQTITDINVRTFVKLTDCQCQTRRKA